MDSILNAISKLELPAKQKVWIGFSGGLDSTVLLHACLTALGSSRCHALHVDHQLNTSSSRWVAHCKTVAQRWDLSLSVETVEVADGNVEQQARLSRYAIFRQRLGLGEYLFTAHHRDDDRETLFWQLFTGRALIGIPSHRPFGDGTLCRPLLHIEKQEIEAYARRNGLTWVEDESNTDTSFDRNWLRHELIPQIAGRFPQAKDRIFELKLATLPVAKRKPMDLNDSTLSIEKIRTWLIAYEVNPPTTVLREILLQADAQADANPEIKVADGFFVRRYRAQLYCVPTFEMFQPLQVTVGESVSLSNGTLTWESATEGFRQGHTLLCTNRSHLSKDHRVIKQGVIHKRLGNLFQESAIPLWLRDGWPVMCEQDSVVSLVSVINDTTAPSWQTSHGFVPRWQPYE